VTAINYVSLTARKRCQRWLEGDVLGPKQDLPDGPLKFQVMVSDPAGNESPSNFPQWCRAFLLNSMETVFSEGAKNSSEAGAMIGLPQKSFRCVPRSGADNFAQRDAAVGEASGAAQTVEVFGAGRQSQQVKQSG